MSNDLKNGLMVAGAAVLLYLLYRETTKKGDVVVIKGEMPMPPPVEVDLKEKSVMPVETVLISAPLNF